MFAIRYCDKKVLERHLLSQSHIRTQAGKNKLSNVTPVEYGLPGCTV